MLKSKTLAVMAISSWLVIGCAGMGSEEKQRAYEQAMAEAQAAYNKSLTVQFAWRDSMDLMKAAEKAAKDGELDKAISLANESRQQSELAYNQYQEQKNAGEVGIR